MRGGHAKRASAKKTRRFPVKAWIRALTLLVLGSPYSTGAAARPDIFNDAAAVPAHGAVTGAPLPLRFEENRGQWDDGVRFVTHCGGFDVLFTSTGALVAPRSDRSASIQLRFGGTEPALVAGERRVAGTTNFLYGRDPRMWRTNVPAYAGVRYGSVAPGVDAVFYGEGGGLEYDLVVSPGADPSAVTIDIDGARSVDVDASGALVAHTDAGDVRQEAPRIYQQTSAGRRAIPGRYTLTSENTATVSVGAFDRALPLVVDPQIAYSARFGGNAYDGPYDATIDSSGAVYMVGPTGSTDLPLAHPVDDDYDGTSDGFIAKLSPDGSSLVYATYIGGAGYDYAAGIAVDAVGNAYVVGTTKSDNFPVTAGVLQSQYGGGRDAFVVKLAPAGDAILYSTYLGGPLDDNANGIAVDTAGEAVVTGDTASHTFPTVNAFQVSYGGGRQDAFVAKVDAAGSSLVYSTYLGGSSSADTGDGGYRVELDRAGDAVVAGFTPSSNFPTLLASQPSSGGKYDGFVTKLSPLGQPVFSTYLGGSEDDYITGFALDDDGDVYAAGSTTSDDFPTVNAFQPTRGGNIDGFVAKLRSDGSGPVYSSYLGGAAFDEVCALAVDADGGLVAGGTTESPDFPIADSLPGSLEGESDGFVAKVDPAGGSLVYSTFLGGSSYDSTMAVAVDGSGNTYAIGQTLSPDFPTTGGALHAQGQAYDVFVTKLRTPLAPDFRLAIDPSTLTLNRGRKSTVDINVARIGALTGDVTATAPDTSSLKIKVTPASGSTTGDRVRFVLKAKKKAQIGTHDLVFTAHASDGQTHSATLTLVVQ